MPNAVNNNTKKLHARSVYVSAACVRGWQCAAVCFALHVREWFNSSLRSVTSLTMYIALHDGRVSISAVIITAFLTSVCGLPQ
jgi:hypothetical protein